MPLLRLLNEVYAGPAWHGPAVKESLAGVDARRAARKLSPERNSIWELVLHLAHGRHLVIERVNDATAVPFPRELREPWWPVPPRDQSEQSWQADLALLDVYQAKLLDAVRGATPLQLDRVPSGSDHAVRDQLYGVAVHDGYHAGQIRLLTLL
jgi:DinB superfamily